MKRFFKLILLVIGLFISSSCFVNADLITVAVYEFNGTLAANPPADPDDPTPPALVAVNGSENVFVPGEMVFGNSRTVYRFNGPGDSQSGLTLDTTSLIPPTNYSVEMVFKFDESETWRRVLGSKGTMPDAPNTDHGFYIDSANKMNVVVSPGQSGPGTTQPMMGLGHFTEGDYHHLLVTVEGNTINGYLDGGVDEDGDPSPERRLTINNENTPLQITSTNDLLYFFLDNTLDPGPGEFSDGNVARIALYNSVANADDAETLFQNFQSAAVPEPSTFALTSVGLGIFFAVRRYKLKAK